MLWKEVNVAKKGIEELDEIFKNKIKAFLKERKWDKYMHQDSKISASLTRMSREVIDKPQLKMMLTDSQYAQIIRTTTYERLSIMTPETRERLKKYVKNNESKKTRKAH